MVSQNNIKQTLKELAEDHIIGTEKKAPVFEKTILLGYISHTAAKVCNLKNLRKVHITTIALKHIYDGKPAEEFHTVVSVAPDVISFPDEVYKNKDGKRGDYCLVKKIKDDSYMCSIDIVKDENSGETTNYIATCYRIRKASYLNSYKLLWTWRGDKSSS